MKRIELLAPAGDLEKLKVALVYGADAVFIGGIIGVLVMLKILAWPLKKVFKIYFLSFLNLKPLHHILLLH